MKRTSAIAPNSRIPSVQNSAPASIGVTIFSLLCASVAQASTIHVSETLGSSPGRAPIVVRFVRTASQPVARFSTRVVFDNTKFPHIVATPMNGGSCDVDTPGGFVRVQGPKGQTDIPSAIYCSLDVSIAPHIAANSIVWLTPTITGPNFSDGGCFDADASSVKCGLTAGNIVINNFPIIFFDGFEDF